ncbi:MAG: Trm112 family protein [Candidatus Solibacter usitatus]|nr:Trm112 family protein [Candidatus Solibacter usitatus]
MALLKELLEILICPACRSDLVLQDAESGLKCTQCRRVYPIRDGIPVMLIDEARIED